MPGEVGLELIEEPSATFPHPERGQPIAWRAHVVELGLSEAVLHELTQCRMHHVAVLDEAEDVGGADVRPKAFAMEPEHDLQDLVSLPQCRHGIRRWACPFEEPVDVLQRRLHRGAHPRGQLGGQLVYLGGLAPDNEDLGRQRPEGLGHREGARRHGEMKIHFPCRLHGLHLDHVHGSGCSAAAHGVGDDESVAWGQELLGEPNPRRAHLHQIDSRSGPTLLQSPNDLDAETIVAAENIAESSDEGAHGQPPSAGSTPTATRISPFSTATGEMPSCSLPPSHRFPVRTS